METDDKKIANVIARAWTDPQFKETLKRDPKAALLSMGLSIPQDTSLEVVESTDNKAYFVLPPSPTIQLTSDELKEKALDYDYRALVHVLYNVCCC